MKNFIKPESFLEKNKLKKFILLSSNIQYPISYKSLATQYNSRIDLSAESKEIVNYKKKNYFTKI